MKAELITYKLMKENSLFVLFFKVFAKNKRLELDILHFIYTKKGHNRAISENIYIDKRFISH